MTLQFDQEWQRIQRLCERSEPHLRSRLTVASGALLSGVLLLRFVPLPTLGAIAAPQPLQETLWHSTGLVRQSVVDLYRIQRWQQQQTLTAAAATPSPESASGGAAPPPAAATAPAPARGQVIDQALEMRVAIAREATALTLSSSTPGWVINTDGSTHCDLPVQTSLRAIPTAQGIDFSGCQLSQAVWLEADAGGLVFVDDRWYRGRVLLFNRGGRLLAVNFVLLGDYLASVVGSEMYHHWPLEALKAQAVAARSYALTHHVRPASDYFDLDNTQRFQAYKGVGWETPNTQQAVAATAGEFISYRGGIVESLYAASDQIVQEAHGGQGMSQYGARDYALQGWRYDQILGAYYPGTSLSRLVVE